jgi:hypothetical protein
MATPQTTKETCKKEHCLHMGTAAALPRWCCQCGTCVKEGVEVGREGEARLAYLRTFYIDALHMQEVANARAVVG